MRSPDWYSGLIFLAYAVVVSAGLYGWNYLRNIARRERSRNFPSGTRLPRECARPLPRGGRDYQRGNL